MAFQRFTRKTAALTRDPVVGIQKRGTFSMNASAVQILRATRDLGIDEEVVVEFLYDPESQTVGLQIAEDPLEGYEVRKQPNSESYLVSGRSFTQYYKLDTSVARRYRAAERNNMLVIDLKRPLGQSSPGRPRAGDLFSTR